MNDDRMRARGMHSDRIDTVRCRLNSDYRKQLNLSIYTNPQHFCHSSVTGAADDELLTVPIIEL